MSKSLISRIIDCDDVVITVKERADLIEIVTDAVKHSGNITVSESPTDVACEVKYVTTQNFSTVFTRRYKKKEDEKIVEQTKEQYLEAIDKKMIDLEYDGSIRTRVIDRIIKSWDNACNKVELKFYSGSVEVCVTDTTTVCGIENFHSLSYIVK